MTIFIVIIKNKNTKMILLKEIWKVVGETQCLCNYHGARSELQSGSLGYIVVYSIDGPGPRVVEGSSIRSTFFDVREIPGRVTLTTSKQDLWMVPDRDLRYHYFPPGAYQSLSLSTSSTNFPQ